MSFISPAPWFCALAAAIVLPISAVVAARIHLELLRQGTAEFERPGGRIDVVRYTLRPTIHWLIDPIVQRLAPQTEFLVEPGGPPALASVVGPRNFGGEEVRIE
jgi:hypothetical protein